MSDYRKTEGGVIREADGAFIPEASGNRDWQAYLAWSEKGGVALPSQSLEQAVVGKASELTQACADAIMAGFTATALGAPYSYDSTIEDQLNLTGLIQLGTIFASDANWKGGFKCADAEGVKEKRDHTLKQLQQVGVTFVQRKQALIDRKDVLVAKAQACTTVEQVEAIAWTEA